jgi:hypothetical protein
MESTETDLLTEEQARRREIGLRARKRLLESREFKLLSLVSGAYVYTTFTLCMSVIGFFLLGSDRGYIAATICAGLASLFVYAVYRMWRRRLVSPWLLAAPSLVFLALMLIFHGWFTYQFWFNIVASVALIFLARTWREQRSVA